MSPHDMLPCHSLQVSRVRLYYAYPSTETLARTHTRDMRIVVHNNIAAGVCVQYNIIIYTYMICTYELSVVRPICKEKRTECHLLGVKYARRTVISDDSTVHNNCGQQRPPLHETAEIGLGPYDHHTRLYYNVYAFNA